MRTCFIPGSFDPPTIGHIEIITRAAALFDRVVVGVMDNGMKRSVFSPEERANMMTICLRAVDKAEVIVDGGLSVEAAKRVGAEAIVRGLRGEADISIEMQMAAVNMQLSGIETLFLFTMPQHSHISSTMVREVARHGGSVEGMVPKEIHRAIVERFVDV